MVGKILFSTKNHCNEEGETRNIGMKKILFVVLILFACSALPLLIRFVERRSGKSRVCRCFDAGSVLCAQGYARLKRRTKMSRDEACCQK